MSVTLAYDAKTESRAARAARRQSPRVHVDLAASLRLADGRMVDARLRDLSLLGARIETDRAGAHAIHPSGRAIRAENAPELFLTVELSKSLGARKVVARCAVANFEVVDLDRVSFGLEFITVREDTRPPLEQFIERALEPAA